MSRSIPARVLAATVAAWFVTVSTVPAALLHHGSSARRHAHAPCGHEHASNVVDTGHRCCAGPCCCAPGPAGTIPLAGLPLMRQVAPTVEDVTPGVLRHHGRPSYLTPFPTGPPLARLV